MKKLGFSKLCHQLEAKWETEPIVCLVRVLDDPGLCREHPSYWLLLSGGCCKGWEKSFTQLTLLVAAILIRKYILGVRDELNTDPDLEDWNNNRSNVLSIYYMVSSIYRAYIYEYVYFLMCIYSFNVYSYPENAMHIVNIQWIFSELNNIPF